MNDVLPQILFVLGMNALGFVLMGQDKKAAQRQAYRISERTLMGIALFGGAMGIYAGMNHFHHKTKKPLFTVGVPFLIVVNLIGLGSFITSIMIQ